MGRSVVPPTKTDRTVPGITAMIVTAPSLSVVEYAAVMVNVTWLPLAFSTREGCVRNEIWPGVAVVGAGVVGADVAGVDVGGWYVTPLSAVPEENEVTAALRAAVVPLHVAAWAKTTHEVS